MKEYGEIASNLDLTLDSLDSLGQGQGTEDYLGL